MTETTARDLLFKGYEVSYHEIDHFRLRQQNGLLAAEQQMITDAEMSQAINALPLMERCRELAIKHCKWGLRPAVPAVPATEGQPGRPAEPEREFTLEAKTTAVMMMATNSTSFGDAEARAAYNSMQVTGEQAGVFEGMVQLVAMSRASSDRVPLVALALRERGQVKGADGEWLPLSGITEADVRVLPQGMIDKVYQFLLYEQTGWPKDELKGGFAGKSPSARRPRSSSK